jgi:hypothetical protein
MKYIPLTGTTPTNFTPTFIFSNISGKDLTFTVEGGGTKSFRMFQAGDVFETNFSGQGDIECAEILTDGRALVIGDPGALQPTQVRMIKVRPTERIYELNDFESESLQPLLLHPTADQLNVDSAADLQFNLKVQTFANNAVQTKNFQNVTVQANRRGTLAPSNWNNLPGSQLKLQLLRPQNLRIIE